VKRSEKERRGERGVKRSEEKRREAMRSDKE
jgi:hypothetical protein